MASVQENPSCISVATQEGMSDRLKQANNFGLIRRVLLTT